MKLFAADVAEMKLFAPMVLHVIYQAVLVLEPLFAVMTSEGVGAMLAFRVITKLVVRTETRLETTFDRAFVSFSKTILLCCQKR